MSVRIYQLSKQVGMTNSELIELLKERGHEVKTASNTVDNISAESLVEEFGERVEKAPEPETVEAPVEISKAGLPPGVFVKSKEEADQERLEREEAKKSAAGIIKPPKPKIFPTVSPEPMQPVAPPFLRLSTEPGSTQVPPAPLVSRTLPLSGSVHSAGMPASAPPNPAQTAAPPAGQTDAEEASEGVEETAPKDLKKLQLKPPIVVRDFAGHLGLKPFRLISELMELGIFASMNQVVEEEVAQKLALKHGFELEVRHRGEGQVELVQKKKEEPKEDEAKFLEPRPPVVCILGHVDHGKTTLLDTIRKANVVAGEAGGITQHIGAYQVEHNDYKITFIDTPGHAAFSKMRARGASATDVAILVVAADDGFMPQTDEALGYLRSADLPIIVAVNKIDTKGADIDRVKRQMQEREIAAEDWGGETLTVPISALNGENIDELLDSILLQAEMMEKLKANPKCPPEGVVIEAQKEAGRGATASVIVQKGTLRCGHTLLSGSHYCKVRAMTDESGETVKSAPPSTPVRVIGWSSPPDSGAIFRSVKNEKLAKSEAGEHDLLQRREDQREAPSEKDSTLEGLLAAIARTQKKVYRVVLKADVFGTVEALGSSLEDIQSERVELQIVQGAVGPISKNDVLMASASNAAIVGFNVNLEAGVSGEAKHHGINIYLHNVIYELIEIVKEAMADTLEAELVESKVGAADVRQVFPVGKSGQVAGCMVTEGRISRDGSARVLRNGNVQVESKVSALKRFKEDANEVRAGYECGIRLDDFNSFEEGDIIECFETKEVRPSL